MSRTRLRLTVEVLDDRDREHFSTAGFEFPAPVYDECNNETDAEMLLDYIKEFVAKEFDGWFDRDHGIKTVEDFNTISDEVVYKK